MDTATSSINSTALAVVIAADDNPVNQQILTAFFNKLALEADVVSDGSEVLLAFQKHPYQLVLMDIEMPGMNGVDAVQFLRDSVPAELQPVVVALTANDEGDLAYYQNQGFDDLLPKPVKLSSLKFICDKYLNQAAQAGRFVHSNQLNSFDPASAASFDPGVIKAMREDIGSGSGALISRVIKVFLEHTPSVLENLDQAFINADMRSIHRSAHTLKSSSAGLGLLRLSALARRLENEVIQQADSSLPEDLSEPIRANIQNQINLIHQEFYLSRAYLLEYLQ